jgi:predicted nucleic acid-binding protein
MKVLIDTNALIKLLDSRVAAGVSYRLKGLLEDIDKTNGQLIIPVQVVGEYISGAEQAGQELLAKLLTNRRIKVANFDHVAAVECAMMDKSAIALGGHKRAPLSRDAIWQKVKVDRQIVAIARVLRVDKIISTDGDITKIAKAIGMPCMTVEELPLPSWAAQVDIDEVLSTPPVAVTSIAPAA